MRPKPVPSPCKRRWRNADDMNHKRRSTDKPDTLWQRIQAYGRWVRGMVSSNHRQEVRLAYLRGYQDAVHELREGLK